MIERVKPTCSRVAYRDWYSSRGITICQRWRQSFENFLADMGEKPSDKSLDRINNDGNYEPSNCRWATPAEQSANTRTRRSHAEVTRARKALAETKEQ